MQLESQTGGTALATGTGSRLITTVLVGATFMAGLDLFIVNVAFEEIRRDFAARGGHSSFSSLSWILNGYAVVFAALLIPMGRIADRYGRREVFLSGLVLFGSSSLGCALSGDVWILVTFRILQAGGAAAMTPASLGLLVAATPLIRRAAVARLWALSGAVAAAAGPAVGGLLIDLSWHWAFLVNVPISLLLIWGTVRAVPSSRGQEIPERLDLAGALVLVLAVGALVTALVEGNEWGWKSTGVLTALALALGGALLFGLRTVTHPSPIIDLDLLRVPSFLMANVATLLFNVAFGACLLAVILWMQDVWHYSAIAAGLAIAAGPLVVPVTSLLSARYGRGISARRLAIAGSVIAASSGIWMSFSLSSEPAYLTTFLPSWVVMGVAVGLTMPNLVASAASALPPHQLSTGTAVVSMSRQIGIVLGVSLLVGVLGSRPSEDSFRHVFWLVAAASVLAAGASRAMSADRS